MDKPLAVTAAPAVLDAPAQSRLNDGRNQIVLYAPGETLPATQAGDFLLVQGTGLLSRLIRFGERLHHARPAAQWSHAALIVSNDGTLIEALSRGIRQTPASKYDKRWRALVHVVGSDDARLAAVRYADSCLSEQYGILDFLSVALSQLLGLGLIVTTTHAQICSEFVAHSLERLGYIFPKTAELTTPADLYELATEPKSALSQA